MASNGAQQYNTATLRQLLLAAFTAEELRRFCYDRPTFRPVINRFGPGHGLDDMIDELITYCETNLLMPELLNQIKEVKPRQHKRFESDLLMPTRGAVELRTSLSPEAAAAEQTDRTQLVIVFHARDLTEREKNMLPDAVTSALAKYLMIPLHEIQIISVEGNSVKIIVEVPNESAEAIMHAVESRDPELLAYLSENLDALMDGINEEKERRLLAYELAEAMDKPGKIALRFEPGPLVKEPEASPAEKPAKPTPEKPATARPPAKIDSVTWLHISDLQFSTSQAYDTNTVLEAFLRDVVKCAERYSLHPDFIFVTGDIASSGNTADYDPARQFFDDLLEITHLDKARLFLVPGNHDVNRAQVSPGAQTLGASFADRADVDAVLASSGDRQLMFARFAGYADFVNSYLGKHLPFDQEHYFYTRRLEWAGKQIALLGLNSAWLSASDHDEKEGLVIGERQVRLALDQAAGADLKIALLHHSFDRLRKFDRDDVEAMLCDDCDFVLHSHAGQTKVLRLRGPDAKAMVIAAGGHDAGRHPSSYNYVHLDPVTGAGTVHLRCYSPRRGGFWIWDTATYRNASTGRYRFPFAMEKSEIEPKSLKPGDTIRGQYTILKLIRQGGMARVWLAEQPKFGRRKVAIKEPLPKGEHHEEFERRFQQEIDLAPQLERLPQVVRAYTLEHRADGAPLLVMEYIDGGSLADLMIRSPDGLPIAQALKIAQEILKALARFHRLPDAPVHRDIKPSNILLDPERGALLGDFGLAQLPGSRDHPPLKSHPGTPPYMAPEQAGGLDPLTPAADLYAVGCVLFEMLTGKRYKYRPTGTTAHSIRQDVPAWLDRVLTQALAEEPSDRYRSAEDLAIALAREGDLEAEAKDHHALGMERWKNRDLQGTIQQLELAAKKYDELGLVCLKRLRILRAIRSWIRSHKIILETRRAEREY
jgi:hypothetical protein